MNDATLSARVCAVIAGELGVNQPAITPDTCLIADLECDPLSKGCIACALDEEFGVEIPDNDLERWETVAEIIETMARLTGMVAA